MTKIDIRNKKILFLGYGGVAKCTWNYFAAYFKCDSRKVYIVDKCKWQIFGPNLQKVPKKNIIIANINSNNFNDLLKKIGLKEGDLIIDLTFSSDTYYFIQTCFLEGLNYMNTSIEDDNDSFFGTSIDLQQKIVKEIYENCKKKTKIRSNILTEFGQNPGLIQHYIFYSLNKLNKMKHGNSTADDYSKETMLKVVDDYQIGTIYCSEIDNLVKQNESATSMPLDKIYNTWSVGGMLSEALDKTELVHGLGNNYVQPTIPKREIDKKKTELLPKNKDQGYEVFFLRHTGMHNNLNSICPVLDSQGKIKFVNYEGKLIHHGEMFEMANYFGKKSPFMTYVYKVNKYADQSIKQFYIDNPSSNEEDLSLWVMSDCNSFEVFNNIGKKKGDRMVGHDSIGCTIYCGKKSVERIFWCGSILSDTDQNVDANFTPTIVQVAAGVLSGLSYIMEEKHKGHGLYDPTELDTNYILQKATPLLGKFFFTEIPKTLFTGKLDYKKTA